MYQLQIIWLMCLYLPWLENASILDVSAAGWRAAGPGEIPYQIAIKTPHSHRKDVYVTICNAFLVRKNKALSSAHCFFSYDPKGAGEMLINGREKFPEGSLYAVAGTLRNTGRYQDGSTEQWRRINHTVIPSKYSYPYDNIAIAIMAKPFVYNKYVKAIPYASKYIEYDADSMDCEISVYGKVSHSILSDTLIRAKVIPATNRHCTFLHGEDMKDFICTKTVLGDVFPHRSGGPLICRKTRDPKESKLGVVVGVLNEGSSVGSIFTRVSAHKEFIKSRSRQIQPAIVFQVIWVMSWWAESVGRHRIDVPVSLAIFNGNRTTLGQIPWQVALKYLMKNEDDLYDTFCSGAIISEKKILSAAHCLTKPPGFCRDLLCLKPIRLNLRKMYAVAGTLRTRGRQPGNNETEQWRRINKTYIPDQFIFPKKDMAVAVTREPFMFNEFVKPVPYAKTHIDYGAAECLVAGYGKISYSLKSDTLLAAYLTLIPASECSILHERVMDNFICTTSDHTDVGLGDSGGPLVCFSTGDPEEKDNGVLVGVVSGMREDSGTFFTRVSSYTDFIESNSGLKTSTTQFWITFLLITYTRLASYFLFYFVPWNCILG